MVKIHKVVLDGEMSDPVPVTSGVPQGTVLGPLMFLLHRNDINQNINSKNRLFADDCVLYREINLKLDCLELQQDLQKLVDWSHTWQMSFNISKCHTLHAHRKKQPIIHTYTMDDCRIESNRIKSNSQKVTWTKRNRDKK